MAVMSPLAAALSMQQPIMPSSKAQIAPTDVLGAYQLSTNAANQQYLAKMQQQNSLWGGLAGLGGSALTASILKGWNPFSAASTALGSGATGSVPASFLSGGLPLAASGAPGWAGSILPADLAGTAGTGALADAGTAAGADAFGAGATAVPWLAADATGAGAAGLGADAAGTVGADLAAAAAPAAADAGGLSLASILPFLFAA
jgi:hypothetical protein